MSLCDSHLYEEDPFLFKNPDGEICEGCILDSGLKIVFDRSLKKQFGECKYCENEGDVLPVSVIADHIRELANFRYTTDDKECPPWNSSEGGYPPDFEQEPSEILFEIAGGAICDDLFQELENNIVNATYCKKDWQILWPHQAQKSGWKTFINTIKYKNRFVFLIEEDGDQSHHPDEIPPSLFLYEIEKAIHSMECIRLIPKERQYYRVRTELSSETPLELKEFCSPPQGISFRPNRFSPEGISRLYIASDEDTAINETKPKRDGTTAIATLSLNREVKVLDFTNISEPLSHLDPDWMYSRYDAYRFFKDFLKDLTILVNPDEPGYTIDYIPTQVVADFIFKVFKKMGVEGIMYSSAQTKRSCLVLDWDHEKSLENLNCEQCYRLK